MRYLNLNIHGLKRFQEDILALWLAVYTLPPEIETPEDIRSLYPSLLKQSEHAGFTAIAALDDEGRLVGLSTGWNLKA